MLFIGSKNQILRRNYLGNTSLGYLTRCVVSNIKIIKVKKRNYIINGSNLKQQSKISNEISSTVDKNMMYNPYRLKPNMKSPTLRLFNWEIFHSGGKNLKFLTTKSHEIQRNCLLNRFVTFIFDRFQCNVIKMNTKRTVESIGQAVNHRDYILSNKKLQSISTTLANGNQIRLCSTVSSDETRRRSSNLANTSPVTEKLQTSPKNVLHNIYDTVAQEFNNRDLKLQPSYNIVKEKKNMNLWCCTYNVKWPECAKFVSVAHTKRDASHKAALSALLWLKKNGKITKDGQPILLQREEIKEVTKRNIPDLVLDSHVVEQLRTINDIYKNEFVPILTQSLDNQKEREDELDELCNFTEPNDVKLNSIKQRIFTKDKYLAKEKVQLPISQYKQEFIKLLKENRIVIVKGEPGCGKSTRIPQYILESWAQEGLNEGQQCRIVVTQPRRIATISLANRVSSERDEHCGHIVGYQVRLNSNFNPSTGRILYCTTGILLRHLQSDLTLSSFTHVILDEAHERDVNTDLLMNLVRTSLQLNSHLKLIVMSATVDTEMFRNYFENSAVMHIPGFTYPVQFHFLDDFDKQLNLSKTREMCNNESPTVVHEDVVKVIDYIHKNRGEGAILCFLPGWEDISRIEQMIPPTGDMSVLCLHSRLKDSDQWKIFSKAPPGVRKVILSTNIAETSVTIDDVVYVVDTGIHKENRFDSDRGVTCIDNYWISQASMTQRKGRAGRVQPGESFHLYTKSKHESLPQYTDPEILKTSLTKIVLNSKVYSNNMDALEFMSHLPSPPEENATKRAVRELKDLELLDEKEKLTSLGKTLANFQLEPKLAKVLVNAVVYKCVTPVVDIVTLFSSDTELFGNSLTNKEAVKMVKTGCNKYSDHLAMMRLFEGWLDLLQNEGEESAKQYCFDANLTHHKFITINKLRKIHFDYLYNGLHESLPIADDYSDNDELVKAVLLSGVGNMLKRRDWDIVKNRYKKRNVFLTNSNQKATIASESVNFKRASFPSDLFVYFNELRSNIRRTTLIRECSVISPLAVLLFSPKQLIIKKNNENNNNKVVIELKESQVDFFCDEEEAASIQRCKEALNNAYQYFIFQMTEGGECNQKINKVWDSILKHIDTVLLGHNVK